MRRFASIASGLFACVAGCGDDGVHKLADAPLPPDDAIDAPASGTANITTNVRCCAVAAGTPQAGVQIVVIHGDRTVGATATTDAQGKATVTVSAGDSVHAIYPEDTVNLTRELATYVGVKPGDNLTFGEASFTPDAAGVSGQINVSWPAVTGAHHYQVFSPCDGAYTTGLDTTFSLFPYCQTPTAPIVFVAYDLNDKILATSYLPAATFTPGTLPAITWTTIAAPNYAVSVSGLDAAVDDLSFYVTAVYPRVSFGQNSFPPITGGAASATFTAPASATRMLAEMNLRKNGTDGRQTYFKAQPTAATFTAPMPWINGIAVSLGEGKAVWLQTAGTYDAATFAFNWNTFDGTSSHYFNWNVIVPPGVTMLDFGTPPAALAPYLPSTSDNVGTDLRLVDLANASSYDELRALGESFAMDPYGSVQSGAVPSAGMSSYDGGEGFSFVSRAK